MSSSSDAPEFDTIQSSYSRDNFYTGSRDADKESRWVRIRLPAAYIARVEDLIHERHYPAYHSIQDVVRDGLIHLLHYRLSRLDDIDWKPIRDAFAWYFEVERVRLEQQTTERAIEGWKIAFREERDPKRLAALVAKAREQADEIPSDYWRDELDRLIYHYDR